MSANFILTDQSVSFFHKKPHTAPRDAFSDREWDELLDALERGDMDRATALVDRATAVTQYVQTGGVGAEVRNGVLYVDGNPIDTYPARKALDFMHQNRPVKALIAFIQRLEQNPSYRARHELYGFLEHGRMPLTADGHFLAYKKVRTNHDGELVDIYTQKNVHRPGQEIRVPRNQVDEDPNRTCSHGLHVCSYDYLPSFGSGPGDKVIIVEVDPADVVAVPTDYNNTKMRTCGYTMVEVVEDWQERGHDGILGATDFVDDGCDWNDDDHDPECPECGREYD